MRPLSFRNSLVQVFHREVLSQSKNKLLQYLEPVQLGQSRVWAAKLVLSMGGAIRANRDHIRVKIDLSTFN